MPLGNGGPGLGLLNTGGPVGMIIYGGFTGDIDYSTFGSYSGTFGTLVYCVTAGSIIFSGSGTDISTTASTVS